MTHIERAFADDSSRISPLRDREFVYAMAKDDGDTIHAHSDEGIFSINA